MINGYTIPEGWSVLVCLRAIHMDPEYYRGPKDFDPSRWDDLQRKGGDFLPFGAGNRFCPGSDLAKLEMSIFLHYFILNYEVERTNPNYPITYYPGPKPLDNLLVKSKRIS